MTTKMNKFYSLSDSYVTFTNNPPNNEDTENNPHREGWTNQNSDESEGKATTLLITQTSNSTYVNKNHSNDHKSNNNNTKNFSHSHEDLLNWWLLTKKYSDSKVIKNDCESSNLKVKNTDLEFNSTPGSKLKTVQLKSHSETEWRPFPILTTTNGLSHGAASELETAEESKQLPVRLSGKIIRKSLSTETGSEAQSGSKSDSKARIQWNDVEYWNFCSPNNTTDEEDENSTIENGSSTNDPWGGKTIITNERLRQRRFSPTKFPRLKQKGKRVDHRILRNLFNTYFKNSISSIPTYTGNSAVVTSTPSIVRDKLVSVSVNNQNIDINGDRNYDYDCTQNQNTKIINTETENGNTKSCESCKSQYPSHTQSILKNHETNEQELSKSILSVRQREALMGRRRGVLRTMSENSDFYSIYNELDDEVPVVVFKDLESVESRKTNSNTSRNFNTSQRKQPLPKKSNYEYNFEKKCREEDFNLELASTSLPNQLQTRDNQNITEVSKIHKMDGTSSPSPSDNQTPGRSTNEVKINREGVKALSPIRIDRHRSLSSDDEKPCSFRDDDTSSIYSTAEEDHLELESDMDPGTSSFTTPVGSLSASKVSLISNHSESQSRSRSYTKRNSSGIPGTKTIHPKKTRSQSHSDHDTDIDNDHDNDNDIESEDTLNSSDGDTNRIVYDNDNDMDTNLQKQTNKKDSTYISTHSNSNMSAVSPTSNKYEPLDSNMFRGNEIASDLNENPITKVLLTDKESVTVKVLQGVFDCFKAEEVSRTTCEFLLDSLMAAQSREDFQWALHQLGGFNALLFLYARVVEICPDDEIQSKGLSLVLVQLRHHSRLTEGPAHRQYHLIRFVLSSERSCFGFKTFIQIMNFCLSASGLKLVDYQLLDTCILSSWQNLTRTRCTENDAPTGPKTLFECLLTIVLDLLEERNQHREYNVALLKANRFTESLLAICYHMVADENACLIVADGLRFASLVKSILAEIMAPPDAYVAVTLVKFGLCPLLPNTLPTLPRKEDAFFIVQNPRSSSSIFHNMKSIREAEEANEGDRMGQTTTSSDEEDQDHQEIVVPGSESESEKLMKENDEKEFITEKDDVPEIVGIQNITPRQSCDSNISPRPELEESNKSFSINFRESLLEGIMSILLNALAIIPDGAFHSVLNPHMSAHLILAFCSHPSVQIKKLALKLLSAYLTRVKNPVVVEFLKCKGFYLTSFYIQGNPEISQLALNICSGFGPLSYSLVISLLYSNPVVNKVIEWVREDPAGKIPALMSMGLLPSIFNIQASSTNSLQKPLQNLLIIVTRFCALHPKDDPWKILFCPALESSYGRTILIPKIIQEATESLRKNTKTDLKKSDSTNRLMWLLERGSGSRMGHHFDKWLLNIFTLHVMEMDEQEETENWIFFVKKNRKKLIHLMGIFLCRVFAANRDNLDFKHYTVRVLLNFCPNVTTWLAKVIKHDEQIERCFTAFVRIFLNYAEQKCVKLDSHLRTPSFHSLISDNGNLTLTLQMAAALPSLKNGAKSRRRSCASENGMHDDRNGNFSPTSPSSSNNQDIHSDGGPDEIQLSDRVMRTRFENVLVTAGILSPTSNYSTFSSDFRNFKLLLGTSRSGVSPIELRHCIAMSEKMRAPFSLNSHRLNGGVQGHGQNGAGSAGGKNIASTEAYFEGIYEQVQTYAMEMLMNVSKSRTQQEVEVARRISVQDEDVTTLKQWVNVMEQLKHPKAPWHFPESYPSFSALDQSEGPGRVRIRLKREHLKIHNRFVLPTYRKSVPGTPVQPLDYLFASHSAQQLNRPYILNEIHYMRFCTRIIPGEELHGEIILTQDHLTFIAEHANSQSENVEVRRSCIKNLLKRRYTLEDRAVEIFLECRSFVFVFKTKKDREEFVSTLAIKPSNNDDNNCHSVNSTLLETSMTSMTSQWLKGQLSNFEYLMYLNTAAGRTYCDLMQYPVFPFVLSKYDCPTLDLLTPQSYRDLKKPMAIQDPSKEEHFITTYNYLNRESETAPFHYGSHYSNSGIVLHFLVRLPPYTQHFLKYQDGSFDIPDRSFHSIHTTWRLASRESNTDFKEAIPEFYYLPEFLQNLQHFDLGVRQNGMKVDEVILPPWAKGDARLFTLINRQALESNHVRKFICDWIDLIFGYKQEGKAALQAINLFHPSTYEGFKVDGCGDELLIRARKAMVSTYGQTPKQLFAYPHPRANTLPEEKCDMEVLDTVWGIRWGNFIGSPACPDLEVIHTREYNESIKLFETKSRVVFWPENTLILGDAVVGYWDANSIRIKSTSVFFSIGDDITCCVGTTNSVWVGHQSGRISVLKLSPKMDKVMEKVELIGHYEPVKRIDVNMLFSTAISCSGENYAILWDINKYPKIAFNNAIECSEPIDDIYSSRSTGDVVLVSKQSNRVTLATINGAIVGTVEPDECIESACLSAMDPGRNVNVIAVGCENGIIRFYSTYDMKFLNQLKVLPLASLSIKSIRYSKDGRRLYCMSQTEEGAVTVALQLS